MRSLLLIVMVLGLVGAFGGDGRPEDAQIADRGKPQPVDQEIAREP
jgi:hypothetical protein